MRAAQVRRPGRPGRPSEVAPTCLLLAGEDGRCLSGQVLHPNGGEAVSI